MRALLIVCLLFRVDAHAITKKQLKAVADRAAEIDDWVDVEEKKPEPPRTRLCPDGTYVYGTKCQLCPDGKYVGHDKCQMGPDGKFR